MSTLGQFNMFFRPKQTGLTNGVDLFIRIRERTQSV